jgi:cation transport regulator ChaC
VFGYGSLIWRPDFPFFESRPAWIVGWARRFWQGSHDHRGTEQAPGRVLTLTEAPGERCHGRAYRVGREVFEHLDHREKNGYERIEILMYLINNNAIPIEKNGVVYRADPRNPAFLGPAPLPDMAAQIARSVGPSGSNREYLLELAAALRELEVTDEHVFALERHVLAAES